MTERTPESRGTRELVFEQRISFEERFAKGKIGERTRLNEDGTETTLAAYRLFFDPRNADSQQVLANFVLRAYQAGYTEVTDRLLIPDGGISPTNPAKRITSAIFFFQKPAPPKTS